MADRIGVQQQTIPIHLQKMPELAKLVNTDLSKGFTVPQVAEKHERAEPLVQDTRLNPTSWLFIDLGAKCGYFRVVAIVISIGYVKWNWCSVK